MLRRALMFLSRRLGRTLLIFGTLFVLLSAAFTALLLFLAARDARIDTARQLGATVGYSYHEREYAGDPEYPTAVTAEMLETLQSVPHVSGIDVRNGIYMLPENFKNHKSYTGVEPSAQAKFSSYTDEEMQWARERVSVTGVYTLSMNEDFFHGDYWLINGEPPETREDGAVISRVLADENGLSIGDTLRVSTTPDLAPYMDGDGLELVVTGIFDTKQYLRFLSADTADESLYAAHPYNQIYISAWQMLKYTDADAEGFQSIDLRIDDPENIDAVQASVRALGFMRNFDIWNDVEVSLSQYARPLNELYTSAQTAATTLLWFGGLAVILLFTIWGMKYRRESGIYLTLGYRKSSILVGWWLEILVPALLAAAAALPVALLLAQSIISGTAMVWQDSMSAVSSIDVGATQVEIRFRVQITVQAVLLALATVIGCSLCALLAPLTAVLKLKPREILF